MQRELASLPLPPEQRTKLAKSGFTVVEDVRDLKPTELSRELGVTREEALDLLKLVREETEKATNSSHHNDKQHMTALDMLRQDDQNANIITFCQAIDDMLGGGIPISKVTEICGAPGVGKTQISIQLCVDVQIPKAVGGLEGEAVYIDTEGSFIIDRLVDIAKATVHHCQQMNPEPSNDDDLSLEKILAGVHYFRCHDYVELIALVHLLDEFVTEHPKVKLVVVDSIAFHFRHDFDDYALRTRLLNGMSQMFIKLATQRKIAVVLTNQMTTRLNIAHSESSQLVPALGESWGHASTIRIILYWKNSLRYALLYKSPSRQEMTVPYQVTAGGIRDVSVPEHDGGDEDAESHNTRKRQRTNSSS